MAKKAVKSKTNTKTSKKADAKGSKASKTKAALKGAGKSANTTSKTSSKEKAKAPAKSSGKIVPKSASKAASKVTAKTAAVKVAAKSSSKAKPVSLAKAKVQETSSRESKSAAGSKPGSFMASIKSIQEAMKTSTSIPMFKNPTLEKLSHVHPLTPIFIYIPVISLSIYYYFFSENSGLFSFLIFYISGAFTWTITEYTLHRFLFHPPFSETYLKWFYFYVHGVHHEVPNDATRLVMPPGASIPLAVIFFFIFKALLPGEYLAFFPGFVSGYLVYDFLHFSTHFFTFEWEWFKKLRKHHNIHHFNAPNKNFGVSNSLWDHVFSSKYRSN